MVPVHKNVSGIAGAVIFVILLVLLVWMICVRATKRRTNEKAQLGPGAEVAHRYTYFHQCCGAAPFLCGSSLLKIPTPASAPTIFPI
jgi:hypothetical protein